MYSKQNWQSPTTTTQWATQLISCVSWFFRVLYVCTYGLSVCLSVCIYVCYKPNILTPACGCFKRNDLRI